MILRPTSGWQTITADLALILFLITAQAAAQTEAGAPNVQHAPANRVQPEQADRNRTEPEATSALAIHKPERGESLREWLRATVTDERQVATISIAYTPGSRAEALAEGDRLLSDAEAAGAAARLVLAPGKVDETVIAVDYLRSGEEDGTDLAY